MLESVQKKQLAISILPYRVGTVAAWSLTNECELAGRVKWSQDDTILLVRDWVNWAITV